MKYVFAYFVRMALLNAKPQDCPNSQILQIILVLFYFALSVINALALYGFTKGVLHSVLDLMILYLFTQLLLRDKKERIHQTFNAFLGVGLCIGLVHTFCSYTFILDDNQAEISGLGRILFFLIFIWIISAYGHIVRHATDMNLASGVSISLGFTLVNAIVLLTAVEIIGI